MQIAAPRIQCPMASIDLHRLWTRPLIFNLRQIWAPILDGNGLALDPNLTDLIKNWGRRRRLGHKVQHLAQHAFQRAPRLGSSFSSEQDCPRTVQYPAELKQTPANGNRSFLQSRPQWHRCLEPGLHLAHSLQPLYQSLC